ncbi:MAG: tRNA (adenine-N1)-methyltransferase [Thermoplasmata archaeon]|nr:tRNA (adenine-N1)-methyltransferase [Thermoplasmata archaeon]
MSNGKNNLLTLVDEKGKKFIIKSGEGMKQIGGLGVINTDTLDASEGSVTIAGKTFVIMESSLPDILAGIKRGPQWIMPKDSAQILFNCSIGPGKKVLEVGTGTGALTIVMAHSVGLDGNITTYEINEKHFKIAQNNIKLAGMVDIVEMHLENGGNCDYDEEYDAVTIDMPEPWTILDTMTQALKPGGYLCAYLPTMNQVEKTIQAMREAGYIETHVLENIQRELVVGKGGTRPSFEMLGHTGYLCFGRKV